MNKESITKEIIKGECCLGIEFGSTRIKAVLINSKNETIAKGYHDWNNINKDGIWTFPQEAIIKGMQDCYNSIKENVYEKYQVRLHTFKAIGISGMMHGLIALDDKDNFLLPFRTWRNNITKEESSLLLDLFNYPIPQRWTIAHIYKLMREDFNLEKMTFASTLAGYIHYLLTGQKVMGIGEASGMFPIDVEKKDYLQDSIDKFDNLLKEKGYNYNLRDIFPKVLVSGENAGSLTKEGALLLDPTGELVKGIPFCPAEGDAQTGMVATNSVAKNCGNVSAGTSVFAMVVLEKALTKCYEQLDLVTTPDGYQVAMAHSNNCTSEYDSWIKLFKEITDGLNLDVSTADLYDFVLNKAIEKGSNTKDILSYPYVSGEHGTNFSEGRPMVVKNGVTNFNLGNFMRAQLYASLCAMRIGLDILFDKEGVKLDKIVGHGGFFKTANVGGTIMSAATRTPVSINVNAGEGGAFGIAVLASYLVNNSNKDSLDDFLKKEVFKDEEVMNFKATEEDLKDFDNFFKNYKNGLEIEKAAVNHF